jgi:plastocyanin
MSAARLVRVLQPVGVVAALAASVPMVASVAIPGHHAVGETGSLEGQVILSPRLSSRRPRFRLYTEYGQGAGPVPAARADSNEMANVVIYVDTVLATGVPPRDSATTPEMKQSGEAFLPHVLPVVAGSTVNFPNGDPFFHNVFSLSRPRTFDLGRYPKGASKSVRFDRPGVVQVFCHIHSDMSAVVFVAPNPLYATPTPRGTFAIADIPPGTYRVTAWHEHARPISATVRIEAGRATRLDFNIPITGADSAGR